MVHSVVREEKIVGSEVFPSRSGEKLPYVHLPKLLQLLGEVLPMASSVPRILYCRAVKMSSCGSLIVLFSQLLKQEKFA